jgi:hypothetical protein
MVQSRRSIRDRRPVIGLDTIVSDTIRVADRVTSR